MPRYDFACEECGKRFEQSLHMDELETAKLRCPGCGSDKVRQQITVPQAITGSKTDSTSAGGRWR